MLYVCWWILDICAKERACITTTSWASACPWTWVLNSSLTWGLATFLSVLHGINSSKVRKLVRSLFPGWDMQNKFRLDLNAFIYQLCADFSQFNVKVKSVRETQISQLAYICTFVMFLVPQLKKWHYITIVSIRGIRGIRVHACVCVVCVLLIN